MENLTHTLAGAILSRAGLDTKTALATPLLIVAANLPDIDVLGAALGESYLDFHRGITHSFIGVAGCSIFLSSAFWAISRTRKSRAASTKFIPLCLVSVLGVLSHPLLDFLWTVVIETSQRFYLADIPGTGGSTLLGFRLSPRISMMPATGNRSRRNIWPRWPGSLVSLQ